MSEKTYNACKAAYDRIATEVSELSAKLPGIRREIQRKVSAEMGEPEKKLSELMQRKAAAALEMNAAYERERPAREAKEKAALLAKEEAERKERAAKNARRQAEQKQLLAQRLAVA